MAKRIPAHVKTSMAEWLGAARAGNRNLKWLDKCVRDAGYGDPEKLTRTAVAGLCGVSRPAVQKWIEGGLETAGRHIDWKQLVKFLAQRNKSLTQESRKSETEEKVEEEYRRLEEEYGIANVPDALDPRLSEGASYYQEVGRKRLAEKLLLEVEERRKRLVDREEMLSRWRGILLSVRSLVERLIRSVLCEGCAAKFGEEFNSGLAGIEELEENE